MMKMKIPKILNYFGFKDITKDNANLVIALICSKRNDYNSYCTDQDGFKLNFYYPSLRHALGTLLSIAMRDNDKQKERLISKIITATSINNIREIG